MVTMLAGALVGVGVALVIAGLRAPAPDLTAAVARLASLSANEASPTSRSGPQRRLDLVAARLVEVLRLDRYRTDLSLTGVTPSRMALEKAAYALVGLVFPLLMSSILLIAGIDLPIAIPALAGLVMGAAMSFVPDVDLRRRGAAGRVQMRRTVCVYLELVALERASDAGAVEALERAAAIGHGQGFAHIRDALLRARLEGRTPWQQLGRLSDELAVPELGDVADIMRLSGEDGAAVLPTLRARAASLRTSLLQEDVTAANQASERMAIPVALLGVAFMALLGFPALFRILFG
jgi:hypothetical protein